MNTISYSTARKNLAKTMEQACDDQAPIIITRQNARSVVMLSLAEYESLEETAYLMRSPKNAARLVKAVAEIETGRVKRKELID